jgi:hypothetical protein
MPKISERVKEFKFTPRRIMISWKQIKKIYNFIKEYLERRTE